MTRIEIEKLSEASKLTVACVEKFDNDISEFMKIAIASDDKATLEVGVSFCDLRDDVATKTDNRRFFLNVPNEKDGYILTARVDGV